MELLGFCEGSPYDPLTWSGSNREIFLALRNRGILRAVHDVEVKGVRRYWGALREYSPDTTVWKHNFLKSPTMFDLRTKRASALLGQEFRAPDAVLQIGAMFDATASARHVPRYCYLDSNCALSERGGQQAFGYYASARHKTLAFQNESGVYRHSHGIFVFSDFLRASMINDFGVEPTKVHTVYAGVNLAVPPIDMDRRKEPTILFIGKDFERKGGPLLVTAFKKVREAVPEAKLVIVGANPQIDCANVEVVGYIDKNTPDGEAQLADLYQRAAVFTMPSHFEPFGIVYAEAMHFAVPCVGVDHYAIPEIVDHRNTGLVVPPNNTDELAAALIYLLRNPPIARAMGMEGKRRAEQLFRWDAVAEKMESVVQHNLNKEATCFRAAS